MSARGPAAGRRPTRRTAGVQEARLELVRRARESLPTLPTESLYRIHDLLERVLAEPEVDENALEELERMLTLAAR